MQRFRWIALQGSSRGFLPPLLLFVFLITTSGIPALAADVSAACSSSVARVVSIQGSIEVLRARQNDWSKITRLDTPLCEGDRLRTGALSRAALFIQLETLVRVDQNTSISISQTAEETLVEFTQAEVLPAAARAYSCGAGYFITRFPRKFKVNTPHLNAAVEGTEFLVAMRCESTELSVFEGKVLAAGAGANVFPAQSISSGQSLTIGGTEPPAIKLLVKPTDAVQWVLYYPPLTPAGIVPVADCRVVAQDDRISCFVARAEQLLRAGRVEEAQAHIGDALAIASYSSDAKALSSIISLVRNDKAEALRLAREAVESSANSAPAWLALSYAQQANFKLEAALTSAQRASELTPSSALAFARVAELQLSLGWTREAEKSAKQAVASNSSESRAHMILGFVHLAQINVKEAREDFGRAIESDSSDPLSRLGLGLAIIRNGKLVEGREQIEIAVALDPTNSLIRSYVGKAYYEENTKERAQLAAIQFVLARSYDRLDPTAWLYEAISKQSQNRSVEALDNMESSIELNNYRAIYRSRLLLDQDLADRGATLARVFADLGFGQLAQVEGSQALGNDPASASAHRFVADSYLGAPHHEVARLSELLQSQLWQPLNLQPIQPQLEETNLFIPRGVAASASSLAEFNPLFVHDGIWAQTDLAAGSNNTLGGDVVVAALKGPVSLSASAFHFETDGFRPNNDNTQDLANGFIQIAAGPETMLQVEARSRRDDRGDLPLRFDPTQFSSDFRLHTDQDTYRLGLRHDLSERSSIIVSLLHQRTESSQHDFRNIPPSPFPGDLTIDTQFVQDADLAEMQNVFRFGPAWFVSGLGYFHSHDQSNGQAVSQIFIPFPPFVIPGTTPLTLDQDVEHSNGYVYSQTRVSDRGAAVFGLSVDKINAPQADITQFNPKLGLAWNVGYGLTLRAAAFRGLSRDLVNNQTIEPTQVAGFNQFFDDPIGTDVTSYGIGIDEAFSHRLFAGAQVVKRDLTIPYFLGSTSNRAFADAMERLGRAYLYWAPLDRLAIRTEYYYDRRERSENIVPSGYDYVHLTTQWGLAGMTWLVSDSWSLFANVTFTDQRGTFLNTLTATTTQGSDRFWMADAEARWRIPLRHGFVGVGVRNLFDQSFQFHDPDPGNPTFYPERFFYVRLNVKL
jgi:tetratricopeptide (TPR) repeat protein